MRRTPSIWLATLLALPAAGLVLAGCPGEGGSSQVQLQVEASPRTVVADGENSVVITVTGTSGGSPASGTVALTTNRGRFSNGNQALQQELSGGSLQVTLITCDSLEDEDCAGIARVQADMGASFATANITFEAIVVELDCDPEFQPVDTCENVGQCVGLSCGPHGVTCDASGACSCPSGVTDESLAPVAVGTYACGDGIDHDCDGFVDCADTDCAGEPCGAHGMICDAGSCVCEHGYVNEADAQADLGAGEYACGDGVDWDCDGLVDCQDEDCDGQACGANGRICVENACICPGGVTNESLADVGPDAYACGDGIDHDCDGFVDCADSDCHTLPCGDGMICDLAVQDCVPDPGLEQVTFWHDGDDRVLAHADTAVPLWVELRSGDNFLSDESVTFTVDGGTFAVNGLTTYTTTTNTLGRATVVWNPGTTPARNLRATVTVDETETSKWVEIQVIGLSNISVQSVQYTTMGVAQSGYQENNVITYIVHGTDGVDVSLPMPDGVEVAFDTGGNVTGGLHLSNTTATTVSGQVQTTAVSGTAATTFSVRAVATLSGVSQDVTTQSIAIVGAKPSQQGMTLNCNRRNVGSYAEHDGTNSQVDISVLCTVTLQDRFGNPIGVPTQVNFMAEGGSIVSPVATSTAPATLGQATTTFRTLGALPRRVAPVAGEPYVEIGAGEDLEIKNPRDGFITIMAYTTGEEQFVDLNGNGVWDVGEPFIDMGEPFLDTDDSGVWAAGKPFVDHTGTGNYDGPNSTWDSNTLIWAETRILATGNPVTASGSGFDPESGISVPWGGTTDVSLRLADENLNPPRPQTSTTLAVSSPTTNPPITITYAGIGGTSFTYPDAGWGSADGNHIRWRRQVVCAEAPTTVCDGCQCGTCDDQRCTIRSRVGPFNPDRWGYEHDVRLTRGTQRPEGSAFEIRASYTGTTPATSFYAEGYAEANPDL
jgi:hypothetical protein